MDFDMDIFDKQYQKICKQESIESVILPKTERIVVFGDIHGDMALALDLLQISKVIKIKDKKIYWTGGKTIVVQIGDQIHNCRTNGRNVSCKDKDGTLNDEDSDYKILQLFTKLHNLAKKDGGKVISLAGNHENQNVMGIMDNISYQNLEYFKNNYKQRKKDDDGSEDILDSDISSTHYEILEDGKIKFKDATLATQQAFKRGNKYSAFMGCTRHALVVIGSNIFVHAGIVKESLKELDINSRDDLDILNAKFKGWMLGLIDEDMVENIIKYSEGSIFWTRILGKLPPNLSPHDEVCRNSLDEVLKVLNLNSIIIGHTPQSFLNNDSINATCGKQIIRVDNGSSNAFNPYDTQYEDTQKKQYHRRTQYLEIINDDEFYICDRKNKTKIDVM
jgi:hypothetical protein